MQGFRPGNWTLGVILLVESDVQFEYAQIHDPNYEQLEKLSMESDFLIRVSDVMWTCLKPFCRFGFRFDVSIANFKFQLARAGGSADDSVGPGLLKFEIPNSKLEI